VGRRPVRLPGAEHPLLSIHSGGRVGPGPWRPFSPAEIQQIARTVRRTPEVMLKVTGGGTKAGAVAAHFDYISRHGELEIETDDGANAQNRDEQKEMLKNWHLELTAAHYRQPRRGKEPARAPKMVYNIVLSMPAPTPPEKVLAASRKFARERFGGRHRYAMVLHTDQAHPHVHLVVKTEDENGRRLHVDKPMLRQWREDFAQLMREQGVAANASRRVVRGRDNRRTKNSVYRGQRQREATPFHERVLPAAKEHTAGASTDFVRTRESVIAYWRRTADLLGAQGELQLAGDVRDFVQRLRLASSDRYAQATRHTLHLEATELPAQRVRDNARERGDDFAR
jgi:relaxase-like protein